MGNYLTKRDLFSRFIASEGVIRILKQDESEKSISGLPGACRAFLLAALAESGNRILYIASGPDEIERLLFDLAGLDLK